MKKFILFLYAMLDTFRELSEKMDNNTATEDEAAAFGCLYLFAAAAIFSVIILAAFICRIIWHLL